MGKRWLRSLPLIVLGASYLLVNFVYGLYPQDPNRVRLPLTVWVVGGAAALWPVVWSRTASGFGLWVASMATVGAALYLVPVWAGHGCWSPDLTFLGGTLFLGLFACAAAVARLRPALAALAPQRAGRIALAVTVALALTVAWALPPLGAGLAGRAGTGQVEVIWHRTSWPDVALNLLPALGRPDPVRPRLAVVSGGRLLDLTNPSEALVRDPATGRILSSVSLPGAPAGNTPASVYREIRSAGSLLALAGLGRASIYDLDTGDLLFQLPDADPGGLLLEDDLVFTVVGQETAAVQAYSPEGEELWERRLSASTAPLPEGQIDVYGPKPSDAYRRRILRIGEGAVAVSQGELLAVNRDGGRLWAVPLNLLMPAVLGSNDGAVVFVAGLARIGEDPGPVPTVVAVSAAGGEVLWREELPRTTFCYHWAALPQGLVIAHETVERDGASDADTQPAVRGGEARLLDAFSGRVLWSIPRRGELVSGFYALGGELIVLEGTRVESYSGTSGELNWYADLDGPVEYHDAPLRAGRALIVSARGYVALDASSGEPLWAYHPAGSGWTATTDGERVFFRSSRGIYCVGSRLRP